MKVRVSQIPEESGKPKYQKKMKTTTKKAKDFDDEEDDDDFGEEPEEDEPKRLKKTMINFIKRDTTKSKGFRKRKCSVKYELLEKVTFEKDFSLQRMR